jgi:uncharacterized protein (DUF302 family)
MDEGAYGISVTVDGDFDAAEKEVRAALAAEGFGVLTEIDVAATLKEKLGVDWTPYRILGACNPPLAHRALQAEEEVGLLLPCNVILYRRGQRTVVAALDPLKMMDLAGNSALKPVAEEARTRLERALARLEA